MTLRLGFIGTGIISRAHLEGVVELNQMTTDAAYELVALADPRQDARDTLAAEAEKTTGKRPSGYADYRTMLEKENLDVVSILVPHHLHWSIAKDCVDAGLDIQMQKPIAISIADGRRIIDYARDKGRSLVVSEPAVLGRKTRAFFTALHSGELVGTPTMLLDYAVTTLRGGFFAGTPWRHLKGMAGAGWFLDHGVHRTHWFLEALGSVTNAYAVAKTLEPQRRDAKHGTFTVDTEDCAMTVLQFESGVVGHWLVASAGHGANFGSVQIYGTEGVVNVNEQTTQKDGEDRQTLLNLIADFSDTTIPTNPMAHSFAELRALIVDGTSPICAGERALEAMSVVYSCLEASTTGEPTAVADVLSGQAHAYEDTIEAARAQWETVDPSRVS